MKKINFKRKGSTIVELLVFMGLLSVFILVLTDIFVSILDVQTESETISSVEQDGRFILSKFMYDIKKAQSITQPASLGDTGNTLQINIDGINYLYRLNGDNLVLENDKGTNKLNGFDTKISGLNFKRLGNLNGKNTIKIDFTLTSVTERKSGSEVKNFETTVGLR